MNDPKKIDTFWEVYNSSRCKTAMLAISIIVFLAVAASEVLGHRSELLSTLAILIIGYWTGRTSKGKDLN